MYRLGVDTQAVGIFSLFDWQGLFFALLPAESIKVAEVADFRLYIALEKRYTAHLRHKRRVINSMGDKKRKIIKFSLTNIKKAAGQERQQAAAPRGGGRKKHTRRAVGNRAGHGIINFRED